MLKWLKRLVFAVFCLALLGGAVYGGGLLLPADARLESTLSVDAEAVHVFAMFDTADGLSAWWPAAGKKGFSDFTAKHTGGPEAGPGMEFTFTGKGRTLGVQTVSSSEAGKQIVYDVDYGKFSVVRTIDLDSIGPLTNITWTEAATLELPLLRYIALVSESRVEQEIVHALEQVKGVAEPVAAKARAEAEAAEEKAKAEAAAEAEAEAEKRRAEKEQEMEDWEYEQEEAPTPIDISKPLPETE